MSRPLPCGILNPQIPTGEPTSLTGSFFLDKALCFAILFSLLLWGVPRKARRDGEMVEAQRRSRIPKDGQVQRLQAAARKAGREWRFDADELAGSMPKEDYR